VKLILSGLLLTASAALAQPLPVLHFDPPKDFTGSLGKDPSAHVSKGGDATINVYPFRALKGPFAEQFRRTLFKELLVPDAQEGRVVAAPEIMEKVPVAGAESSMAARFVENRSGAARYRLRLAVYSAGAVALVDYSAAGADAYQRNWPAFAGLLDSLKVAKAGATAEISTKPGATAGVDGLYLASTRRFVMRIGGPPGSGDWETATRFYLLSPDGRFHRGYGLPSVPGGDVRKFDYAKAEREDGPNTGTYAVKGGTLQLRARNGDAVEAKLAGAGLQVDNLTFKKSALKK